MRRCYLSRTLNSPPLWSSRAQALRRESCWRVERRENWSGWLWSSEVGRMTGRSLEREGTAGRYRPLEPMERNLNFNPGMMKAVKTL